VRAGKVTSKEALSAVLWRSDYRDAAGNSYPARFGLQVAMDHRTAESWLFLT